MKKNLLGKMMITGIISVAMLASTAASTWAADKSDEDVLRVGMECAYAPFNWTQDTDTTPDGSKAEPIYGSDYYAYGYDVAVAQKLADQLGMKLEIHKVEWSSIGISMDAGDYDCIIAGMGKTAEREKSYAFTEPYYYRDNCIVVKAGGKYDDVKGLSDLARVPHSLEPDGYRFWIRSTAQSSPETMRQHPSALWQSPTELQMSAL